MLNQMGIIIVWNMLSTDRRRQCRTMRRVTANTAMKERISPIKNMAVIASRPDENKENKSPSGNNVRKTCCHCSHNKNRTSHLCVRCFYSLREQHSQTSKSCMNTILSMLNCVTVRDLFSRSSADWCLSTCINVSDLLH